MTNKIDLDAEVQSALPAVMDQLRKAISERVYIDAQNAALEEVRKATREWAAAELIPEVIAQLQAGKRGMVEQAEAISNGIAGALGKAMLEHVQKTLQSSYVVKDVAEKLFRGF